MIVYRQILEGMPSDWMPGFHWYVEFHDDEHDMAFPLGIGFVTDPSEHNKAVPPFLDFVLVADQHRRKGVATAIVKACRCRWPKIALSDAISECGAQLLKSLTSERVDG